MTNAWAFTIRGEGAETLELDIYDVVGESFWSYGVSAKDVRRTLQQNKQAKQIKLRINSQGGDVVDGFAIYNLLNEHPANKVVSVDGLAASIASVIAMAGDEISMAENAFMMIHNPWGMGVGGADDLRNLADLLDKMRGNIADIYVARTGQKKADVLAAMDAETWMTAAEAKALGYATNVKPCKKMAAAAQASSLRAFAAFNAASFTNAPAALRERAESARKSIKTQAANPNMDMSGGDNIDCTDCIDCDGCRACNKCTDCTDCKACNKCTSCEGCKDCSTCTKCDACMGCLDCSGCSDCTDCVDCTDCEDCTDCAECIACDGCTDCVGCTDCEDCVGCVNMTGQKGMRGMTMQNGAITQRTDFYTNPNAGAARCRELKIQARKGEPQLQGQANMKLLATLCAILAISADSSEDDVLKAARQQSERCRTLDKLESELGQTGDAAVGTAKAWKESHAALPEVRKELATTRRAADEQALSALVKQGRDEKRLTKAEADKLEVRVKAYWAAKDKNEEPKDDDWSLSQARAYVNALPQQPHLAADPKPPPTEANKVGATAADGRRFEEFTPRERADLKKSDPALYDSLRADWIERGQPAAKPKKA